ncbi:MAG: MOSC domain-containing protein [Actinomycetota bacterium]
MVGCSRFPVKSMQGLAVDRLTVGPSGVAGDRQRALFTVPDGSLLSAKQRGELLTAAADDDGITLPDDRRVAFDAPEVDDVLSDWLGTAVRLDGPTPGVAPTYKMTFDPPDDGAELVDIPALEGTVLDVAPIHLLTTATLDGARAAYPDLDWDVRRFRPNLLLDVDGPPLVEDGWVGRSVAIGDHAVLHIDQPTIRCAMPLRAQPGLDREVGLFQAMTDFNVDFPYHFGSYVSVVEPGPVAIGDPVTVLGSPGG